MSIENAERIERSSEEAEINLGEILSWIFKWKWLILILTALGAASAVFFTVSTYDYTYRATASMVVNAKMEYVSDVDQEAAQSAADIYLAQNMVDTYSVVLKSNRVMEYVISDLGLSVSAEVLREWVDLSPVKDTQVLLLSVENEDPQLAVDIANSLMKVAPQAMMETVERGSLNILDSAKLPEEPVAARLEINGAVGAVLGLMLGLGLVLLIGVVRPKIQNVGDIESKLILRTLGEVPHIRKRDRAEKGPLYTLKDSDPIFIDAMVYIRTVFAHLFSPGEVKSVVITSTLPAEGKSTVTANLGTALAEAGNRVLMIDADMRKPTLHKKLGLRIPGNLSIVGALKGDVTPDEAITKVSPNLYLLRGCRTEVHRSKRLLSSKAMSQLLAYFGQDYDYILLDTPPIGAIVDGIILSEMTDGVVLVVRQDQATTKDIQEGVQNLRNSGARLLGCILNDIKKGNAITGYNSRYYYKNRYRD